MSVLVSFKSMKEINDYPVNIDGQGNRTMLPGDLIYKDFNNDGIISNLDMRPLGYGRPLVVHGDGERPEQGFLIFLMD